MAALTIFQVFQVIMVTVGVALVLICLGSSYIQSFVLNSQIFSIGTRNEKNSRAMQSRAIADEVGDAKAMFKAKLSDFMKTGKVPKRKNNPDSLTLEDNYIDVDYLLELLEQERGVSFDDKQDDGPTKTKAEYLIEQRIKKVKETKSDAVGTVTALSNILNDMRDKSVWNATLINSVMLSIARLEPRKENQSLAPSRTSRLFDRSVRLLPQVPAASSVSNLLASKQVAAMRLYLTAVSDGQLAADSEFLRQFILILYLHDASSRERCVDMLQTQNLLNASSLLPGEVCSSVHHYGSSKSDDAQRAMNASLHTYISRMDEFSIQDTHLILRTLSRYQLLPDIFSLLRHVRESTVQSSTVETIELLSQALVKSVSKSLRAESMSELPKPNKEFPEVVFVGRSNVGKSSLVNCLLNRKALASTSATPGHTRCFHFFGINEPVVSANISTSSGNTANQQASSITELGQKRPPIMARFVDVPGLGFAGNRSDSLTASWRGLLERYLHRRDPLSVVCHLVDARHGITDVDKEMITIAARAAEERAALELAPFRYSIIMTKTDKISEKALKNMVLDIKGVVVDSMSQQNVTSGMKRSKGDRKRLFDGVSVIPTSSVSRAGAELVWELIYANIVPVAQK